jgi:hypothetical protein
MQKIFWMCLAVLALAGCPNDSSDAVVGDHDAGSPTDASVEDVTDQDTGVDAGDPAEIVRETTIALAAPDLPPQYFCFLGFKPAADGSPQGDPVGARGPWGVPDASDPNAAAVFGAGALGLPVKLSSGFPYGAMVRLGIRRRDAPFFDKLAGELLLLPNVESAVFAGNSVDSTTCIDAWRATRSQNVPMFVTKPGQIQVGQSWLAAVSGCAQASTDPQCAGGNNLKTTVAQLDLSGDADVNVQVTNLAPFAGYQHVDLYIQPMRAGDAGASIPDGAPVLVASDVSWTQVGSVAGVRIANPSLALLLVVKHGETPSTTIAIPIQPFMNAYAKSAHASWSGHQTFVLFGRPPLDPSEDPTKSLRLGIFSSEIGN